MNLDKHKFAQIIQRARQDAKLKQSELAERIGISEKHLSKIETGKNLPSLESFFKIIDVLGLTLGDFGLNIVSDDYPNKQFLQRLINVSTEKQLDVYVDVISAVQKHFLN